MLYWTNPMFTAVIAYIWLKETLTLIDWAAIFTSFAGIIVIQNPLSRAQIAEEFNITASRFDTVGGISAIVGALFTAISLMQLRKMGKKVHFLIPNLYQSFTSALIAPVPMLIMLIGVGETTTYGWYEVLMLLAISTTSLIA